MSYAYFLICSRCEQTASLVPRVQMYANIVIALNDRPAGKMLRWSTSNQPLAVKTRKQPVANDVVVTPSYVHADKCTSLQSHIQFV